MQAGGLTQKQIREYLTSTPSPLEEGSGCRVATGEGFVDFKGFTPRGTSRQLLSQRGFSLMEVLVGVAILGIVYATLFSLMSTSLRNVSRIQEREKMVRYSQMKMNELLVRLQQVNSPQILSGKFNEKYSWQATIEALDTGEDTSQADAYRMAKIRLAVTWPGAATRNEYALETLQWVPRSVGSQR